MFWVDASFRVALYSAADAVPIHVNAIKTAKTNMKTFFISSSFVIKWCKNLPLTIGTELLKHILSLKTAYSVIPAKAGIRKVFKIPDSRLRGNNNLDPIRRNSKPSRLRP